MPARPPACSSAVRRRQRRGALEAGASRTGAWGGAQLGGAARLLQPVRLRLLRLRRRHGPRLGSTGTPAGTGSRRSSTPAATWPATGAATLSVSRLFANGWSVGAYVTKHQRLGGRLRRGQLRQGHHGFDPAALGDAVRDAAEHQRRRALALEQRRRAPNIANRLYPTVRRLRRRHLEENWGAFWE